MNRYCDDTMNVKVCCVNFAYCKGAALIFISGCGSAISSAKEGKSGFIYNLVYKELISFLSRANVRAFHENSDCIQTELNFINP